MEDSPKEMTINQDEEINTSLLEDKDINTLRIRLTDPQLFFKKTAIIILASYGFIPLIYFHNEGEISALVFAMILVALHLAFLIIYLFRVKFGKLDGDRKSLIYRILGLCFCVVLLILVAEFLPSKIWLLAIVLLALCVVHTLILLLLMVEVRLPGTPSGPPIDNGSGWEPWERKFSC